MVVWLNNLEDKVWNQARSSQAAVSFRFDAEETMLTILMSKWHTYVDSSDEVIDTDDLNKEDRQWPHEEVARLNGLVLEKLDRHTSLLSQPCLHIHWCSHTCVCVCLSPYTCTGTQTHAYHSPQLLSTHVRENRTPGSTTPMWSSKAPGSTVTREVRRAKQPSLVLGLLSLTCRLRADTMAGTCVERRARGVSVVSMVSDVPPTCCWDVVVTIRVLERRAQ